MNRTVGGFVVVVALIAGVTSFALVHNTGAQELPAAVVEEVRVERVGDLIIERHVLIDSRLTDDPAALADEVTGVSSRDEVTAQYNLNPWKWPASAIPVVVSYSPSIESPRPSIADPIAAAIQAWSAVSPSTFAFSPGPITTAPPNACDDVADGINAIGYVTTLRTGVLGLTCSFRKAFAPSVTVEFDMQLNWNFNWSTATTTPAGYYDLYSTVLHEMGHAAGIGHTCPVAGSSACSATDVAAVMYPALRQATQKRTLTDDDRAALRALYPGAAQTPASPTPVPTPVFERLFGAHAQALASDR